MVPLISEDVSVTCNTEPQFKTVKIPNGDSFPPYNQLQVDVSGSCVVCSITYALNLILEEEKRLTLDSVLQLSLNNELLSSKGNGTHTKATVEIAKLYGNVEWGYFGSDPSDCASDKIGRVFHSRSSTDLSSCEFDNGYDLIRSKLEKGLPVIVGMRMNLLTSTNADTHAVVITGIDEINCVTIADSFSRIATRKGSPVHGKPVWTRNPGIYVATWKEFDASWNSRDDYNLNESIANDPAFSNFNPEEEGYRFWMTIDPFNK
ncbi:hypothetical protein C9374_013661 [Naegleria lovaniensis]|uniref:Peptidase C39-like domain-containing protein n=1 Tax=Naegleria lovaniensis TaxID=51637 RepID=A0AA88GBP8_NAELO|nr:uncharacterized protein C9374_013661 [Naegleria lovaniensis]KAG2372653.1 hypothetical protein C9374_013661 [Naegleria lovaniensis]